MAEAAAVCAARALSVRFPGETRDAVRDVSLALAHGDRVAVLGPSGSGKSTLALALAGAIPDLVPAALAGDLIPAASAAVVQQDVDARLVALSVAGEIAFALENRGLAPSVIDRAITRALAEGPADGLAPDDATLTLSTGWRQRLALAAALSEEASLTVLDEPTAHLDEAAAREAIGHLSRRAPAALLMVEHRVDLVAPHADRMLVLGRAGAPVALGPPASVLAELARRPDLGLRLPGRLEAARPGRERPAPGPPLLTLDGVSVVRRGRTVLADVTLALAAGEIVGVAGPNGAGKTTLAQLCAGLLRAAEGARREIAVDIAYVPQNPALVFASASLSLEARRRRLAWPAAAASIEAFGLAADPERHPLRHSHGEVRRLALAFALAGDEPRLAVLDEPTAGLDAAGLSALEARLRRLAAAGGCALVVSHDTDWLAAVSGRVLGVRRGRVAQVGPQAPSGHRLADA